MKKLLLFVIACTLGLFGTVNAQETSFNYDFNDASVDDWTKIDADGDGKNWGVTSSGIYAGYEGSVGLYSSCYQDAVLYPDNYFVTNKAYAITETSVLSFLHRESDGSYNQENFGVVVSENGTDWEVAWSKRYASDETHADGVWSEENVSLAAYAGKNLYLGFRHYECDGNNSNGIRIDNVKLYVAGEGGGEEPTPEPEPTIPAAPASLVATANGQNSITLTWEAVDGATSYNIYSAAGNVPAVTATEYTYEGLTAGTEYCFEVTAENAAGESIDSAYDCATTTEAEIEEPAGDLCVVIFELGDSYGDGWNGNKFVVTYGSTTTEFGLPDGSAQGTETLEIPQGSHVVATYTTAYNSFPSENSFVIKYESGKEIVSAAVGTLSTTTVYEFDVDCAPTAPEKPIVVARADSESVIVLTVNAVAADYYTIYQNGEELATNLTESTYTVEGLTANTEYCYTVKSFNEIGESELSEAACATTFKEGTAIVQIGDGTYNGTYAPISNYGNYSAYSLTQQIYLQEELNSDPCAITSISFQNYYGGPNTRNLVVYVTNIADDSFTSGTNWSTVTEADIVYQGEHTFGFNGEWSTIEFQTPFIYRGKNICITVNDLTGVAKAFSGYDSFYCTDVATARGIYATGSTQYDCSNITSISGTLLQSYSYSTGLYQPYVSNVKIKTEVAEVETMPVPVAPANLVATATNFNTIALTWEASEYAASYNLYQGETMIASALTETSYTVSDLNYNTEYCFTVTAVNLEGESENSEVSCATTEEFEGCHLVFTLSDTYGDGWSYDKLVVTVDGVSRDLMFQVAALGGAKEYTKEYIIPVESGSTVNVKWQAGASYSYPGEESFVIAYESGVEVVSSGLLSDEGYEFTFVVDCNATPVAPAAPTNVVATANGQNSIIVTWNAVDGAAYYIVYKDGQMWDQVNGTTYTSTGLTAGTEYCYAVQAYDANGLESELSEQVCATTEAEVELPENQIMVGTATTSYYSPFLTILGGGSWFEAIYKAEEIGKAGRIAEIAFSYDQGGQTTADINIYFAETTKTEFGSAADVTPESDLTLVYSGTGVTLCDSAWESFTLDTPFNYSGENNLLLVVTTANTSSANKWNCYEGDANTVLIEGTIVYATKPVMLLTLAEEGGNDEPVDDTKYRLVSTGEGWRAVTYVYESETSDKVIEIREGEDSGYGQSITFLQYDENGVLTGYEYGWAENGEIVKSGSSYQYTGVEYTYTEGVLTAYTETQYTGWAEPDATEYTITRDAEGNVTEVAYGTSQIVYTYENGKLASETKSYYNQWASTPGYETEYIIEYTYDENGNCTVATQYSAYDGEKVARKATEYNYALTIPAENVTAFAYPQEVVPAHANLITRAIDYTFNEDWQTNEIVKSVENVTTYKYNPEVEMEPLAPMALTVSAMSDTELRLSWYSAETAEKFYIYKDGEFYAESTSDTYYAEGLEPSTEYCFSVSAVNGETESPKSEVACGKTLGLVAFYPAELEFGEVRVGNYWAKEETTVLVEIDMLGKTATSITSDNAFFTVPANIDLTASYIMFDLGYDKTAEAGEYTGNIVVTLEGGATVTAPVTATAYAPVTPDVFELAQEITFTEGVYTDTPDFATLHDDYLMPEENEWNDGELMDAVYTFTLDTPSAVTVNVTGQNAQYAIYQAEGFEYPTEETYAGVDRAITTEFSFNFNDGELSAFTIQDNDENQDYSWEVEEDEEGGYKLTSYSYNGWYDENNQWVYIADADERIITNEAYNITAQSVLTFDMHVNGNWEGVIIEVTKDGETFTTIENIIETSYSWDWLAKRVNIGAKLAELGLEYGEYRISLYHDMQGYGELNIDNLVLAEREFAFPEGTYYLFAAAEDEFSVEVVVAETEEVVIVPDPKAYRLESVESFMSTVYTYDEVFTNRVVTMEKEGITSTFTYNKAGQIETIVDTYPGEDEEGNPILDVINTVEYVYNEDGTIATYSEATAGWEPMVTEFTYEDGKLVKTVIAEYEMEVTFAYNAEGLLSEKVTSYSGETDSKETYTYDAEGRLVDYGYYGYDAWDLLDYYLSEGVTYTYNAKGNCATAESYQIFEGEKLYFQTVKYFYDETIANEDVYSFELPHVAVTNVAPAQANVLVKELSYYTEHTENGESINHTYIMTVYNYNPAIILAPVTPMNFTAEVVDGAVELTWEAFADAETFTVYQDGEVLAENVVDGFYTVEGLAAGEYCFVVRAYNAAGASATTEEECVTIEGGEPTPTVPAAPVVTVKEVTTTTIILEWAAVEGAVDYILYFGTQSLGNTEGKTIAGIQGLEPETEYCFTVTAVNAEGLESEHSEEVCATTKPDGIAENTAALNIYPNPVVDRLVIETEANIEAVTIYTVTGVMIYSEVDFNNNTINVSDLTSGVYVMKVRTENGEVVKRFIKK